MTFQQLVLVGAEKHGISLDWNRLQDEEDAVALTFCRPGTPKHTIVIWDVTEDGCTSDSGSPYCASDVVYSMRRRLESRR